MASMAAGRELIIKDTGRNVVGRALSTTQNENNAVHFIIKFHAAKSNNKKNILIR
jgi:hypothetical protein